jgi:hypothetical protein
MDLFDGYGSIKWECTSTKSIGILVKTSHNVVEMMTV